MLPPGISPDTLLQELQHDGIAMEVAHPDLEAALQTTVADFATEPNDIGIVILDHTPTHTPQLRDLAQHMLDHSAYELVIVRTPHSAAVVSHEHSRATLEQAQHSLVSSPDYVDGFRQFLLATQQESTNLQFWPLAILAIICTLACVLIIQQSRTRTSLT